MKNLKIHFNFKRLLEKYKRDMSNIDIISWKKKIHKEIQKRYLKYHSYHFVNIKIHQKKNLGKKAKV